MGGLPLHPRRSPSLRRALARRALDPEAVELREMRDRRARPSGERFTGSPTIRIGGEEVAPAEGEPVGLTCRVYRLRDGRASPTPDPAGHPRRDEEGDAMNIGDSRTQPSRCPPPSGDRTCPGRRRTAVVFTCNHCPYALAWHDRLLDVARDYDGRARVLVRQPQRRRALPARLLRRDERAGRVIRGQSGTAPD